jgi:hypothetical protein
VRKLLLALAALAAAVVAGLGAGAASAGEVNGNCNNAPNDKAAANCKQDYSQGNSICKFSGQNDGEPPPGKTQSYGQDVSAGRADPSTENPGKVGQGVFTLHPGYACNGDHGFLSGP